MLKKEHLEEYQKLYIKEEKPKKKNLTHLS